MRILIVEDQPKMGEALQRGLTGLGHAVEHAVTGVDGLARASSGDFDVVLMDAMLPDADGPELCRRLRAQGTPATLILVTALPAGVRAELGADPAIDAVIAKPFELADVQDVLERLVGRRAPRGRRLERGGLALDLASCELAGPTGATRLSRKELELLQVLWDADGASVGSAALARDAWGLEPDAARQALEVYVARLMKKIDEVAPAPGALRRLEDESWALLLA